MFLQYSKIYQRCFTKVAEHGDLVILQNKFIKYISLRLNSKCVILTIVIILNIFFFFYKMSFCFLILHMPRIVLLEIAHWNMCLFTTYLSYNYKDKKILYMVTTPPNRNKKVRWKIAYQFDRLLFLITLSLLCSLIVFLYVFVMKQTFLKNQYNYCYANYM